MLPSVTDDDLKSSTLQTHTVDEAIVGGDVVCLLIK